MRQHSESTLVTMEKQDEARQVLGMLIENCQKYTKDRIKQELTYVSKLLNGEV